MFFEEEFDYGIIDDTVTDDFLQEWCKENDIYLEIVDNPTRWCAFSQYHARKNGLDPFASTSFAYIISMVMTGMGVSASTERYYKEEKIFDDVLKRLHNLQDKYDSEEVIAVLLFSEVFDMYKYNIRDYEKKTENISVRIGISSYLKFKDGQNYRKNDTETFLDMLYELISEYGGF